MRWLTLSASEQRIEIGQAHTQLISLAFANAKIGIMKKEGANTYQTLVFILASWHAGSWYQRRPTVYA